MKIGWLLFILVIISGCTERIKSTAHFSIPIPQHFETPIFPKENLPTKEKIELGKKLFFDTRLSKNNNISCATCHQPEFAFTDHKKVSIGTNDSMGFRNTPSIINIAYKTEFHMDGGVRTLELQTLAPIIDTNELAGNFNLILEYLRSDSTYVVLFENAFDTIPTIFGLTRSIASYERSLIQGNSPYDKYINGDSNALNTSQKNGLALFNSNKLNCTACHNGVNLTNYSYQNIGLAHQVSDSGRARITYNSLDAGKFMVPSLRNISLTGPYMHDGSMNTLDEVISYFENGEGTHPNKSPLVVDFHLTNSERIDLLSFMSSLTDSTYLLK